MRLKIDGQPPGRSGRLGVIGLDQHGSAVEELRVVDPFAGESA